MISSLRPYLIWLTVVLVATLLSGCSRSARKSNHLARASRDFESGAYDSAKIDYLKVLQDDPNSAVACARLGQIWLEEGAPLRAGAFLKKAEELSPNDSDNRLRLAQAYQAVGGLAEARKEVLTVLQQTPDNGRALVLLAELARTREEVGAAEQAIQEFPAKETAAWQLANANIALRRQDAAAAQQALEKAIAADPKSPEAHQAIGLFKLLQKDQKGALAELKAAAELGPVRSNFQLTYAELLWRMSGTGAATTYLKNVTKKAPDFLPAWTLLGRIAFAAKQYDQALASLKNVFSRDGANVDARLLQSDILLAQQQPDEVLAELEKIDHVYPDLPQVKYRMARAYMLADKPAQAAKALDQALAKNPDFTEAILARAELNVRTGQATKAINVLEDLVKKHPDLKPAQLLLADAYRGSGRIDDAANIFREQIKLTPNAPEPYFFLGLAEAQQDKTDEARKSFEKVLQLSPDNRLAVEQLINLDLKAKDFAAASRRAQEQLGKHPELASTYLVEAKIKMAEGKWTEAETALKKALEVNPNSGPAYDMLVTSYLARQKLPEAVHELEAQLAKAPRNQSALMTLAAIRAKQKDYPKAREAYEKVLELNPKFVPALNNLSYLYAEQFADPDKAYELAQKARQLDSANPAVADTLGWAAYKRGDYQQALSLFEESTAKIGDNPEVQFHLGMAHGMMGQAEAARSAFQKALATSGDFSSRAEAEKRLALLGGGSGPASALPVAQLEEIVQRQPNDLVARLRLAEGCEREKDWTKAVDAYEAALKINPKLGSAALKLARLYLGQVKNPKKALLYAKMARSLTPDDPKVTAVLGRIAFDSGDYSWAYNLLLGSSRQLDSDPKVLYDLAWAAYSLGKVDVAREAMERTLKASAATEIAGDARSFLTLTALEGNPRALASARPEIEAKLKTDPKDVPALMAAAALDVLDGNKAAAIDRYREVLQRFPDFVLALKQMAFLYADDPVHSAEAFDFASKARKALPDDPAVAQLLGQLNYQKKDYTRAIQLLLESARKRPLDATGLYYLGASQLGANEKLAGRQALDQALARGLKDPLAAEAKRALADSIGP
jgi:tetratricopeptide (TPR) repeat protein